MSHHTSSPTYTYQREGDTVEVYREDGNGWAPMVATITPVIGYGPTQGYAVRIEIPSRHLDRQFATQAETRAYIERVAATI